MRFLLLVAALAAGPASSQINIENGWARATAPGAKVAAGYLRIHNAAAQPDRLVGAASASAERVEMHVTVRDGDIARMREVKAYEVPAKGSFELKPGGAHLMFINPRAPFKEGSRIPLTLRFERSGELTIELHVGRLGTGSHHHKAH